jgi:AcrR family transcriptional regulator
VDDVRTLPGWSSAQKRIATARTALVFQEGTDDTAAQLSVGRRTSRFNDARTYTQSVAAFQDSLGGGIQMHNDRTCADDDDAVANTVDGPEVLVAIAERAVDENRRYMETAFASDGTPLDRIVAAAHAYVSFAQDRPHQFQLLNAPPDEPEVLERIADKVDEQIGKLADILAAGVADGTFISTLEPPAAATALWAMMEGVLALGWRTDRKAVESESLRRLTDFSLSTILNGIRTR